MSYYQPFQVTGFHGCDKSIALKVLNGECDLEPSTNKWDWLGEGIYFWEQNPARAFEYADECAKGIQKNKVKIKTPFVLGATILLGKCLNLTDPNSVATIDQSFRELEKLYKKSGKPLPKNNNAIRLLDCEVIRYLHYTNIEKGYLPYDTVRCLFVEGKPIYDGANFTKRGHIEVCVINTEMIKSYFLPRPVKEHNPYLKKDFIQAV